MTTRPTRNETLKAVRHRYGVTELPWDEESQRAFVTMAEAARLYAVLAPDTCPTCKGQKTVERWEKDDDPRESRSHVEWGPCANCAGRGYVWPDTLVNRASEIAGELGWMHSAADIETLLSLLVEVDDDE